ncbi:MAG: efflux transporter outer membrane subunit [Gammaproteobacteria bacterium]
MRLSVHVAQPLLVAFFLCAFSAGGPDYDRPQMPVAPSVDHAEQPGVSTEQAEAVWWRSLNDQTLNRLVRDALAANLDLRIATARLREARALRSEITFDRYPTITSQGVYTESRASEALMSSQGNIDRDRELFEAGFDATWELDFFGRVRRSIQAATAEVGAAEAVRRDVIVSLIAEVARNYIELRGTQGRLTVAQENAENQRETLDLTLILFEGGRGTELDTSRARAQLNSTHASIPPLETTIQQAIHRLGVLTGHLPETLLPALSSPTQIPTLPQLVSIGKPEELLRRRPDIRVAERNLAASTARLGVATADLFPRVTFVGSVALESATVSGLGASGSGSYAFGPQIFWAAFDLGRVRARIDAADADTEASLAEYEGTVLEALEETENALVDFGRQRARRDFLQTAAKASAKAAEIARLRYQSGVEDFLAVLDAERTLLEAEDRLAESEIRSAAALIADYKALGGGWEHNIGAEERSQWLIETG